MREHLASRTLAGLVALGCAGLVPAQAQASDLISAPMALVSTASAVCPGPGPVALAPASKASAILGGAPSALERIRMEQNGGGSTLAANRQPVTLAAQPVLAPAAAAPMQAAACLQWLQPQAAVPLAPANPIMRSTDIFGSKRLAVRHTMFDAEWARVERDTLSRATYRHVVGQAPEGEEGKLEQVNRWVNRHIAYADDQALFGRGDFWAGASKTLKLREGDCEDIAITKMQLLAAAGVPREDMILTIARDLVRGADHAVLIVRLGERYALLDNSTDAVLDGSAANDYRPVLSFGEHQAWLHGYQAASALGESGSEGLLNRFE